MAARPYPCGADGREKKETAAVAGVSERLLRIADESGYAGWVREASGEKNNWLFLADTLPNIQILWVSISSHLSQL